MRSGPVVVVTRPPQFRFDQRRRITGRAVVVGLLLSVPLAGSLAVHIGWV